MRKRWVVAAGAVLASFALTYLASPYLAVRQFVLAARSGDADRLAASVDFSAVRTGLKPQLSAAVTARVERDPGMRGNPLAGLGLMLVPTILDRMVDSVVTPNGIATLVRLGRTGPSDGAGGASPRMDYDYGYAGIDHFRLTVRRKESREQPIALTFERRRWLAWKLVRIDIPQTMLADSGGAAPRILRQELALR